MPRLAPLFLVLIALSLRPLHAMPGPEIPQPAQRLEQALRLATAALKKEGLSDAQQAHPAIPTEIRYTRMFLRDPERPSQAINLGEHCWVITFTHPVQNDHTWTYKVSRDGKITLISHSI